MTIKCCLELKSVYDIILENEIDMEKLDEVCSRVCYCTVHENSKLKYESVCEREREKKLF